MKQGIGQVWLSTEAMVVHENKIWFAEADSNEVYSYDLETKNCSLVCEIAEEPKDGKRLFRTMVICDNKLYLFPFTAKNAYRIYIDTRQVEMIKLEMPTLNIYEGYRPDAKFLSSFVYQNKIFVVGVTYPTILEYEIATGNIIYHKEWLPEIKTYFRNNNQVLFRRSIVLENKLYIPSGRGNFLLIYDMQMGKYEICQIDEGREGYSSICFDGDKFWLIPLNNGPIVKWDGNNKKIDLYHEFPDGFKGGNFSWDNIIFWRGTVILLPGTANMILKIDKDKHELLELDSKMRNVQSIVSFIEKDYIYFFSKKDAFLWVMNQEMQIIDEIRIVKFDEKNKNLEEKCILESRGDTLEEYLFFLRKGDEIKNQDKIGATVCGWNIWRKVIENK